MLHNLGELAVRADDMLRSLALFIHAERILRGLQSPLIAEPAQAQQNLREQLGERRYAALHHEAEQMAWEDIIRDTR
jgi:hypothetical protein